MKLNRFITRYVITNPKWKAAYELANATREADRALMRSRPEPSKGAQPPR